MEKPTKDPLEDRARTAPRSRSGSPTSGAARRFSILLATTDVGRPVAEDAEAAASEASEWDGREREERLAALREEEERGGGRNRRNFFILSCIHSLFFFLPYFLISFLLPPIGYDWRIAGGRLRLDGSGVAPIRRSG